jgi:predicted nucleic acid-binding protein
VIVVDASVAVKWYLPEEGTTQALALLRNPEQLIAPSIIKMEVSAAITRRIRDQEKPITAAEAKDHCEEWFADLSQDAVRLVPEDEILLCGIALSGKLKHPLQDCLYLAVAEMRQLPFVTADQAFIKKTRYPKTFLLSKWRAN